MTESLPAKLRRYEELKKAGRRPPRHALMEIGKDLAKCGDCAMLVLGWCGWLKRVVKNYNGCEDFVSKEPKP